MADQDQNKQAHDPMHQQVPGQFVRADDFQTLYANNIQFQPNELDLKLVFGEVDTSVLQVNQHTAIIMSWLQAKLMLHYLTINLTVHELANGKIHGSPAVFPMEPQPPTGELATNPTALAIYEYMKKARTEFIESLQ
jgi:hypothetical protein